MSAPRLTLMVSAFAVFALSSEVRFVAAQAAYRARTDVVALDLVVLSGGKPVTDIAARDIVLTDKGVPQSVELMPIQDVPLDLTLVVDVSSATRPVLEQFKNGIRNIQAMLLPQDRLRLFSFSTSLAEIFGFHEPSAALPLDRLQLGGATSLYDALAQILMRRSDAEHRQLLIAFTDGVDTSSVISPDDFLEIAARWDGTIEVIWQRQKFHSPTVVQQMARRTGGFLHELESEDRMAAAFARALDQRRRGYVVLYKPTGVALEGWHDVVVKLNRPGTDRYTIHVRRGYHGGGSVPSSVEHPSRHPDAVRVSENSYGLAYEIDGPMTTPSGRVVRVCSIWQIDTGSQVPRFITMYPR